MVNRNSKNFADGRSVVQYIIAILENMQGKIDQDLPVLL